MSESVKKRPVPFVERNRPTNRESMIAAQSRIAVLPAPLTPDNTFTCSENSNRRSRMPLKLVSVSDFSIIAVATAPGRSGTSPVQ